MNIQYIGHSVQGKDKDQNQDQYSFIDNDEVFIAVVADGVSSCKYGKEAAVLSCKTLIKYFEGSPNLRNAFFGTQRKIFNKLNGEGFSTLSVLGFFKENQELIAGNIGDSPIIAFQENCIIDLYKPHVTRAPFSMDGHTYYRNFITQAMGQPAEINPHITKFPLKTPIRIVLASDGIPIAKLKTLLKTKEITQELVNKTCQESSVLSLDDSTLTFVDIN